MWAGGSLGPGELREVGVFWGSVSRTNSSSKPVYVSAWGGNGSGGTCGNRYHLAASVLYGGKTISVAGSSNTYDVGYKTDSIGFMVPANSSYQVVSNPYACGAGQIILSEFLQ